MTKNITPGQPENQESSTPSTQPEAETTEFASSQSEMPDNQATTEAPEDFITSDSSHIDAIRIETEEPQSGNYKTIESHPTSGKQIVSKYIFYEGFRTAFNVSSGLTKLESLAITDDAAAARLASDAIYDVAYDTPFLRFIIEPSNLWVQRSMAILAFSIPKYMMVKAEIEAKKQTKTTGESHEQGSTSFKT